MVAISNMVSTIKRKQEWYDESCHDMRQLRKMVKRLEKTEKAERLAILNDYLHRGYDYAHIAIALNMTEKEVKAYFNKPAKRTTQVTQRVIDRRQRVEAYYRAGLNIRQISKLEGVSDTAIRNDYNYLGLSVPRATHKRRGNKNDVATI